MFTSRSARSSLAPYRGRPLRRCALLAAAAALPLACDDTDTTAPGGSAASTDAPAAAVMDVQPIAIEALTGRHAFTDEVSLQARIKLDGGSTAVVNVPDPSRVTTLRITVQPGARFPWHTHPGPVVVTVAEGDLVLMYAEDCVRRPYGGAVFVDPGNSVHTAYNPSATTPTVLIATFFGVPASGPVTLALPPEQQSALDVQCGATGAAVHAH